MKCHALRHMSKIHKNKKKFFRKKDGIPSRGFLIETRLPPIGFIPYRGIPARVHPHRCIPARINTLQRIKCMNFEEIFDLFMTELCHDEALDTLEGENDGYAVHIPQPKGVYE